MDNATPAPQICLASQSPRRRQLLRQIGIHFTSCVPRVAENPLEHEPPRRTVCRLAAAKARAGWQQRRARDPLPVLGADTLVLLDGDVFGKPRDARQGQDMLRRLSGRRHQVLSAVSVVYGEHCATALNISQVRLRHTSAAERRAYWRTGEPRDKAGAYAVQGYGAIFVTHIEGSYSGVMGLPLHLCLRLLRPLGVRCPWEAHPETTAPGGEPVQARRRQGETGGQYP